MQTLSVIIILTGVSLGLYRARAGLAGAVLAAAIGGHVLNAPQAALCWLAVLMPALLLSLPPVLDFLMRQVLQRLPSVKLSASEMTALAVGGGEDFTGTLMRGTPDWSMTSAGSLSAREQAFLDGPVAELAARCSDWDMRCADGIPGPAWDIIRKHRMFGLCIPEAYGGHGFSALMHHRVIARLASTSGLLASTVGVPNSLGPAELLLTHGTEAQRQRWLAGLASGQEIPCFGLTGWQAGSDASALPDTGTVAEHEGTLGLWVEMDKRYITLAPIATLIGIACRVRDPDHLLGENEDVGITLVLIPRGSKGLQIGARHLPMDAPLSNGTVGGRVFVPMAQVIGEHEGLGQGWRMLMECLATGRSITLPSVAAGTSANAMATSGAYIQLRKQFGRSLISFEGVQQTWLDLAVDAWTAVAASRLAAASVDAGQASMATSAIAKYHATECGRRAIAAAMDLHGGRGIQAGPSNYLALAYQSAPISITVEGANILTRHVMIHAPALFAGHPFLKDLAGLLSGGERDLNSFKRIVCGMSGHVFWNVARCWLNWRPWRDDSRGGLMRRAARCSAALALCNDAALVVYGADLKRREFQSARLGDALSALWLTGALHGLGQDESGLDLEALRRQVAKAEDALDGFISQLPGGVGFALDLATCWIDDGGRVPGDAQLSRLARAAVASPALPIRELGFWPADSAAGKMIQAGDDLDFRYRLQGQPGAEDLERLKALMAVDSFN